MIKDRLRNAAILTLAGSLLAAGTSLAAPSSLRPWVSPTGDVRLFRPTGASATRSDVPLGSLMAPGWRLMWDGKPAGSGQVIVRLAIKVVPAAPQKTATEVLQVGSSRNPAVVRTCLRYGLQGGSGRRLPDRVIGGRRFAVWHNGDAGMSQAIDATSLRAVVNRTCYAIERFRYGESASDGDPAVTVTQAQGAAMLDAALNTLRLGRPAKTRT